MSEELRLRYSILAGKRVSGRLEMIIIRVSEFIVDYGDTDKKINVDSDT